MRWTFARRGSVTLWIALFVSIFTGCAKVTLINQDKAKRGLSTQNALSNAAAAITVQPVPGFAIVSGGGMSRGEGISVQATVGEATGSALQSGGTINLWSGVQSTISN